MDLMLQESICSSSADYPTLMQAPRMAHLSTLQLGQLGMGFALVRFPRVLNDLIHLSASQPAPFFSIRLCEQHRTTQ